MEKQKTPFGIQLNFELKLLQGIFMHAIHSEPFLDLWQKFNLTYPANDPISYTNIFAAIAYFYFCYPQIKYMAGYIKQSSERDAAIKEIRALYKEVVDNFVGLCTSIKFTDPIKIFTLFTYTLSLGYLSVNETFAKDEQQITDLVVLAPVNIICGNGVCRHISPLLTDIFCEFGFLASPFYVCTNKEGVIDHMITAVLYNDILYLLDPTNDIAYIPSGIDPSILLGVSTDPKDRLLQTISRISTTDQTFYSINDPRIIAAYNEGKIASYKDIMDGCLISLPSVQLSYREIEKFYKDNESTYTEVAEIMHRFRPVNQPKKDTGN